MSFEMRYDSTELIVAENWKWETIIPKTFAENKFTIRIYKQILI